MTDGRISLTAEVAEANQPSSVQSLIRLVGKLDGIVLMIVTDPVIAPLLW